MGLHAKTAMPYSQVFHHIVWSTKNREPLLTPDLAPDVFELVRTKVIGVGATVFALNGIPDHIHLVASIPPQIAVAMFISQVKGAPSAKLNKLFPPFAWQNEYGVYSFDGKRLAQYVAYVARQKKHHARAAVIATLECDRGSAGERMHKSANQPAQRAKQSEK